MSPVASLVIPLKRQHDAWLKQCVLSAVMQSAPCEVLVVRAGDTPGSNLDVLADLQRQWENLRVILEEKPGSFPAALNLGIRESRCGRVGFLLSDDWLDPEAVARCVPRDAAIVCTGHMVYYEDGVTINEAAARPLTMAKYLSLPGLEAKATYLSHFFLFRKSALADAGGLDETIGNFPGIDDYDLIWTLLERGASVAIVEEHLYYYRDHGGERLTLAPVGEAAANLEKILRKHGYPEAGLPERVRRAAKWFGKPLHVAIAEDRSG